MVLKIFILTVSSTRSNEGSTKDTAGPALEKEIFKDFPDAKVARNVTTDEQNKIESELRRIIQLDEFNLIITVGGTGFSKDDVTPEATKAIIEKEAPGLVHVLLSKSLAVTNTAMLSRPVCGIKDETIVVNFPGSARAAVECWGFIKGSITHAVDLVIGAKIRVRATHEAMHAMAAADELIVSKSKVKIDAGALRLRKSKYTMVEVGDALEIVFQKITTLDWEEIPVSQSLSRILAENIEAQVPIPPFPASIKDGYAVIASDGAGKRKVRAAVAAGDDPKDTVLQRGEVIRISTGAAVPKGADAVVQIEDTDLVETSEGGLEETVVEIKVAPTAGQDIRKMGSDCQKGTKVLQNNAKITAAYVGVLAMLGYTKIKVFRQPLIGIISTGNELCPADAILKPGQIRDSNKLTLINLLKSYGYDANDCGIARDTPNDTKRVFEKALQQNDVIISSGGVSMGEYDLIKEVLIKDFGATIQFGRLNMKPGKPTVFATLPYNGKMKYVFALPGNPVSCCVTSLLFVLPALKFMENGQRSQSQWPQIDIILEETVTNKDVRPEYVRLQVSVNSNGKLAGLSTGNQISSRLNSMVNANALLLVPGKKSLESGTKCSVSLFGPILP